MERTLTPINSSSRSIQDTSRSECEAKLESSFLNGLKGRRVTVSLRSGYLVEGVLVDVSRYEILVDDGRERYVIFKHAVDYIIPSHSS